MTTTPPGDGFQGAHAARIEVYAAEGRHWFRLFGTDGESLLESGDHVSRAATLRDVERLRGATTRVRACMTPMGLYYFEVTLDGLALATSTKYVFPADRDAAQERATRVLRSAPGLLRLVII